MINLALLREETERVLALLKIKDPSYNGALLAQLDAEVRLLKSNVEALRSEKNDLARKGAAGINEIIRERSIKIGLELKTKETELIEKEALFNELYMRCPNIPAHDVPAGNKEENKIVKTVGNQKEFNFPIKNHVELGEKLGWFNFEAAARMTGTNFVFYQGQAVTLMYALTMLMLKNNMKHGFKPMLPPYLVNEKSLENASNFPKFKDSVYTVGADNLYLTPTAEVNLTNLYRDHIFAETELPVRMTAWTSCFRREAGTYGASERGLIRIHQFEKVELYTICPPDQAAREHELMLAAAEEILQLLGLHYRVSLLAAQDSSFPASKTYDIEVWMPGQKAYYEVSSSSNCGDFQARRTGIRYRPQGENKPALAHTLNTSSLALPRLIVALMETYQQPDGSIALPDILKSITIGV